MTYAHGIKYETIAELTAAVAKGEVTSPLVVDNDAASVYQDGECVFSMDPSLVTEQALDLLGIAHEAP